MCLALLHICLEHLGNWIRLDHKIKSVLMKYDAQRVVVQIFIA